MITLIERLKEPFFSINWTGFIEGDINFSTIVYLFGGIFIMYTAVKEIKHMLEIYQKKLSVDNKNLQSNLTEKTETEA